MRLVGKRRDARETHICVDEGIAHRIEIVKKESKHGGLVKKKKKVNNGKRSSLQPAFVYVCTTPCTQTPALPTDLKLTAILHSLMLIKRDFIIADDHLTKRRRKDKIFLDIIITPMFYFVYFPKL